MTEQFKTWSWVKAYQVGERLFDKIALEDTFPKDKPDDECIDELEQRITAQAKRKYPHLFNGNGFVWHEVEPTLPKEVQIEKPTEEEILSTEQQILSCKELKTLESYKLIVKKNPGLQLAYSTRYEQLNQI